MGESPYCLRHDGNASHLWVSGSKLKNAMIVVICKWSGIVLWVGYEDEDSFIGGDCNLMVSRPGNGGDSCAEVRKGNAARWGRHHWRLTRYRKFPILEPSRDASTRELVERINWNFGRCRLRSTSVRKRRCNGRCGGRSDWDWLGRAEETEGEVDRARSECLGCLYYHCAPHHRYQSWRDDWAS